MLRNFRTFLAQKAYYARTPKNIDIGSQVPFNMLEAIKKDLKIFLSEKQISLF